MQLRPIFVITLDLELLRFGISPIAPPRLLEIYALSLCDERDAHLIFFNKRRRTRPKGRRISARLPLRLLDEARYVENYEKANLGIVFLSV
jgi:hypothetical protein